MKLLASLIGRVNTIEDVVAAMRAIEAALPEQDGVRWFNLLYRRVTESVQADAGHWEDGAFLQRLDVEFAKHASRPLSVGKPIRLRRRGRGVHCFRRGATRRSCRCSSRWRA